MSRREVRRKTYGRDQRASKPGNHRPVESQEAKAKARVVPEQRVDRLVLWCDPADPAEHAETGEQESGDEVVQGAGDRGEEEELLARDVLRLDLAPVLVERVEQRAADKRGRPDHAGRPHEEPARDTGERVSDELGRKGQQELVADGRALVVEGALREEDRGGVDVTVDGIGHDRDDGVLLDAERTGVERPDEAEGVELRRREGPFEEFTGRERDQLRDESADRNRRPCARGEHARGGDVMELHVQRVTKK